MRSGKLGRLDLREDVMSRNDEIRPVERCPGITRPEVHSRELHTNSRRVRLPLAVSVQSVLLVSGDRESEVRYLADQVGIDEVYAERTPEEKVTITRAETRRAPTLFIGDGPPGNLCEWQRTFSHRPGGEPFKRRGVDSSDVVSGTRAQHRAQASAT